MSGSTKVVATGGLFVLAVATVVISAVTHSAIPLFFAWLPLVAVGWVLTRPEPGSGVVAQSSPGAPDGD
jgi:hypothetical protein